MKFSVTLLLAPILMFTIACSPHYSVSNHGHRHHRSHVSVGVHGNVHSDAGSVIGALIVGGVIGHILTEEANSEEGKAQATSNSNQRKVLKRMNL